MIITARAVFLGVWVMRVGFLHATDPAGEYEIIDSRDFASLSNRDEPPQDRDPVFDEGNTSKVIRFNGTPLTIDTTEGLCCHLNIHGIDFTGDHVAVEHLSDRVRVYSWNDDAGDYDTKEFSAAVWDFFPFESGKYPDQRKTWYLPTAYESALWERGIIPQFTGDAEGNLQAVKILPWSDFIPPGESITRHGAWLLDSQYRSLAAQPAPSLIDWRGDLL